MEGWPGHRRGSVSLGLAKQRRWMSEAGAGGPGSAGGRRREIEEECRPLDVNPTPCLGFDLLAHMSASPFVFLVHLVGWVKQ